MKVSSKPELSAKWWASEKPAGIKGAELEKALERLENALADEKKKSDTRSVDACLEALDTVGTAVERTINKECDRKDHKEAIAMLKKFDEIIKGEVKRLNEVQSQLEDEAESEEEEANDNILFDHDHVCKMLQMLKSTGKQFSFSIGLNSKSPAESQLLLCRKRSPDKLWRMLKQTGDFQNRQLAYGKAQADPENGQTLLLLLEDNEEPPQMLKISREFLRSDKKLRFRKLKLVFPGGQMSVDTEPDVDDDTATGVGGQSAVRDDLSEELATVTKLVKAWQETLDKVSDQIDKLRSALEAQTDPTLQSLSKGLGNVMGQFPDLDLNRLVEAAKANDRAAYDRTVTQTGKEIREVHNMLTEGPLLSTIDENPFVKTNVHTWVNAVLKRITDVLNVKA